MNQFLCKPFFGLIIRLLWAAALVLAIFGAQAGVVLTTLYSFSGPPSLPFDLGPFGLVQGSDGNFYGMTSYGGNTNLNSGYGYGTVFKISTNGALTSLYSFTGGGAGAYPNNLVQGSDGNFYGTTSGGGTSNVGSVFQISTNGIHTNLYSFRDGNDGSHPLGLVQGSDGYFYGTTRTEPDIGPGPTSIGTVFRISTNGVLTSLHSFGVHNGPDSRLVQGSDGNFYGIYGTTYAIGGCGTVFKISTNSILTNFYSFSCGNDGDGPFGLVQGSDGNFYGMTYYGGNTNLNGGYGYGTVFKISSNGALTTLHSFTGTDGDNTWPSGTALVLASDGNFYGMTYYGGNTNLNGGHGYGTVFKISTNGALTTLYSFTGTHDGADPDGALVQASDGNFYGTTSSDGTYGYGTFFRLTIVPEPLLTIIPSDSNVILFWPTNFTGYMLQQSIDLDSAGWTTFNLQAPPIISNGQFLVSIPNNATNTQQFFRLSQRRNPN